MGITSITATIPPPGVSTIVTIRATAPARFVSAMKRDRGAHHRRGRINHTGRRAELTRGLIDHRRRLIAGRRGSNDHTRQEWQPETYPDVMKGTGLRSRNGSD